MNFAIVNLGCKVNRVESDSFASGLLARGGLETGPDTADVVVVNTCMRCCIRPVPSRRRAF